MNGRDKRKRAKKKHEKLDRLKEQQKTKNVDAAGKICNQLHKFN
jgi:hypothetical protein